MPQYLLSRHTHDVKRGRRYATRALLTLWIDYGAIADEMGQSIYGQLIFSRFRCAGHAISGTYSLRCHLVTTLRWQQSFAYFILPRLLASAASTCESRAFSAIAAIRLDFIAMKRVCRDDRVSERFLTADALMSFPSNSQQTRQRISLI